MSAITLTEIENQLASFKQFLVEDVRDKLRVSPIYRVIESKLGKAHWPVNYGEVWSQEGEPIGAGVYLHFNEDDHLLYVGKAVSLGSRLGGYFKYAEDKSSCRVIDPALKDSCAVRVVALPDNLAFLAPSLEWFFIEKLNPPVNKQGRTTSDAPG